MKPKNHLLQEISHTGVYLGIIVLVTAAFPNIGTAFSGMLEKTGIFDHISSGMIYFYTNYFYIDLIDVIAIGIGILLLGVIPKRKKDVEKTDKQFIVSGVFAVFGASWIGLFCVQILEKVFSMTGHELSDHALTMPQGQLLSLVMISISCVITGPILEEILFRGIILKNMEKYGKMSAVFISAICFTIFHFNFLQIVTTFLIGILLGILTIETDSIKPEVIAHILNNAAVLLPDIWLESTTATYHNVAAILNISTIIIGMIGAIFFIYKSRKRICVIAKNEVMETGVSVKNKIFYVLKNPVMIVLIVLYIIEASYFLKQLIV